MGARALFRGPCHVLVSIDDTFRAVVGDEAIGRPFAESFITPNACQALVVMDRVYRTGIPESFRHVRMNGDVGKVTVIAVRSPATGRIVGVATDWQPVRAPIAQALLQPLGLLSVLLAHPGLLGT